MKKSLVVVVLIGFLGWNLQLKGQVRSHDLDLVEKIADRIMERNSYQIVNVKTGEKYTTTNELPVNNEYCFKSPYLGWYYVNGVLNLAFIELGDYTQESKYEQVPIQNYDYFFDQVPYFQKLYQENIYSPWTQQFFEMDILDHCGAMGAGLVEVYQLDKQQRYHDYIEKVADFMLHKELRLSDGTLARIVPHEKTIWLDDLYMSVPFLARMGQLTGKNKYYRFAAKQVIQFTDYLYDPQTGLYFHCYYDDLKENGVAHWGRANGWSILAQCNLLDALPENFSQRDKLLEIFQQQIVGFSRYQGESGLWHQLLDKNDSYLEVSCSAMFTYAVAKGVNEGWIDQRYASIAMRGWSGIAANISPEGDVSNICVGTGIQDDLGYYYKRPVEVNDNHGLGVVIMAGVEVSKMKEKLHKNHH